MRIPSFSHVDLSHLKSKFVSPLLLAMTSRWVSVIWILERMKGQGQVWEGRGAGEHGPVGKWVREEDLTKGSAQSKENIEAWKTDCPGPTFAWDVSTDSGNPPGNHGGLSTTVS